MSNILVVDDMSVIREPLVQTLQNQGYDAAGAESGAAALKLIAEATPQLILLDLRMPGMDGLQFLRILRRSEAMKSIPVMLLTEDKTKTAVMQAAKLGIQGYLLKSSFSLPSLLARIKDHLKEQGMSPHAAPGATSAPSAAAGTSARVEMTTLLTREDCIERAKTALGAKTISGAVGQVIAMAASPRSDATQLATLIGRDPMLSARILQAANSAAYTSKKGAVTTIPEAIRNIGVNTVRNVAAAIGIIEVMPTTTSSGYNPIRCWQHSFAVAQLCERLCSATDPESAGAAYLVGLCHDLGEILFHTHFEEEYTQVLAVEAQTGTRRELLEFKMLGMTHGELLLTILQQLGLPDMIRQPIEGMHKSADGTAPRHPLTRILSLAEMYANGSILASSESSPIGPLTQDLCKDAVGKTNPEVPDSEQLRNEVYTLTGLLARLPGPGETRLMQPLYGRHQTHICLVRDPSFSSFDPIFAALESMATTTLRTSLPSKEELDTIDGLVLISPTPTTQGSTPMEIEACLKTASNQSLQTLWLTGEAFAGTAIPNVQNHLFPLPLATLATFVQSLPIRR